MKLQVRAFRGIESADIDLDGIALIAGSNAQGKTSILQSLAAIACDKIPFDGMTKQELPQLVKSGNAAGEVQLVDGETKTCLMYPSGDKSGNGEVLELSRVAAGLDSLVNYNVKDRAKAFCELLQANPTLEDLKGELKIAKAENYSEALWKTIELHGWDVAHKNSTEKGATYKREWREITEEQYGSDKGAKWVHPNFTLELETKKAEEIQKEIADLQDIIAAAKNDKSLTEEESTRLQKLVDKIPDLNDLIDTMNKSIAALNGNYSDISTALNKLPAAVQPAGLHCPDCGSILMFDKGVLCKISVISDTELENRRKAIADTKDTLQRVQAEIDDQKKQLGAYQLELKQAQDAGQELAKKQKRRKTSGDIQQAITEAEKLLEAAQNALDAQAKTFAARNKHNAIVANAEISKILAPEGLRKTVTLKALDKFNAILKNICETAGWRRVEVKFDMSIFLGGTSYSLCSKSEKYIVRVALQLADALISKSKLVIIDDSDDLLMNFRNGLFSSIINFELKAVVALATDLKNSLPNLSEIGGSVYWVENGIAVKV